MALGADVLTRDAPRTGQQNRNAKAIADRAAMLYDKFVGFTEDLARVGDALERARSPSRIVRRCGFHSDAVHVAAVHGQP